MSFPRHLSPAPGRASGRRVAAGASAVAGGFTLVELLVVIGIIAVLISILLPTLSKSRESARRVSCLSNVRQFCAGMIMYANDNRGVFPDSGNSDGSWTSYYGPNASPGTDVRPYFVHNAFRDELIRRYKYTRANFFCPSNPARDDNELWNTTLFNGFTPVGYLFIGGRFPFTRDKATALTARLSGFEEVPAGQQIAPRKIGDKSFYRVLVADTTRSYLNAVASVGGGATNGSPVTNHISIGNDPTGFLPQGKGGTIVGYSDGSGEWRPQNQMGQALTPRRRQTFDSIPGSGARYYW